jgi:hypothetical protein
MGPLVSLFYRYFLAILSLFSRYFLAIFSPFSRYFLFLSFSLLLPLTTATNIRREKAENFLAWESMEGTMEKPLLPRMRKPICRSRVLPELLQLFCSGVCVGQKE